MSSTFKLAKKKYTQNDLRKLMSEQKKPATNIRINSPSAKYEGNELICILCKTNVKNTNEIWKVHINAKMHTENVALAKQLKEKFQYSVKPQTTSIKRPYESYTIIEDNLPTKKIKSILKGSTNSQIIPIADNKVPDDFFDKKTTNELKTTSIQKENPCVNVEEELNEDDKLPEGFFDDPKKDAKARNQEYKDANEEEWEKFQKEIKLETTTSAAIINDEQEEATAEREIDDIDEQMRNWSRLIK